MPINQNIERQHSEEVAEIIGSVPNWLVRWGITLFFSIIVLVLSFSAIIKSPDIVKAKLVIDVEKQPQLILARKPGKLVQLFVKAEQIVEEKQVLGFIESQANHSQVLDLSKQVERLHEEVLKENYDTIRSIKLNTNTHYGELQPAFLEFYLAYLQYLTYTPDELYERKKEVTLKELHDLKLLQLQLLEQEEITKAELALAEQEFEVHTELAAQKVISPMDFNQKKAGLLNKKLPIQQIKVSIINNSIIQSQKEKELLEVSHMMKEQRAAFLSRIQKFKSELASWKRDYILVSERKGTVVFQQLLKQNQLLGANEAVMYIIDKDAQETFGELTLGQQSFGKVKVGQKVLIRLSAYPSQEFGVLKGRITYISNILQGDSAYTAKVSIAEKTTYGEEVELRIGLVAEAEVITEEKSLLSKIFSSLNHLVKN